MVRRTVKNRVLPARQFGLFFISNKKYEKDFFLMVKNKHFLDPFITINRLISKQAVAIYNRSPIKFNLGIKQFVFNRKHNHLGGIANI